MDMIEGLKSRNNSEAYELLTELEKLSESSDELYGHFDGFMGLTESKSAFVRMRGFRLACAQAKWDTENRLEGSIDILLEMLRDEKGTQVRQGIGALGEVILHKPMLREKRLSAFDGLDMSSYKESMRELIKKDIDKLRNALK